MAEKLKFSDVRYLSFEGGGGRGIVYKGVVDALEKLVKHTKIPSTNDQNPIPTSIPTVTVKGNNIIFPVGLPIQYRQLKGVCGSSAGAITAFMLAMGMDSKAITEEMGRIEYMIIKGKRIEVSPFEKFLENPNLTTLRAYTKNSKTVEHDNKARYLIKVQLIALIKLIKSHPAVAAAINGISENDILRMQLLNSDTLFSPNTVYYIQSLLFNRGLFSGLEVRKYLGNLMKDRLYPKLYDLGVFEKLQKKGYKPKKAEDINFRDFFNLTGVDLIITGTNITQNRPGYFSVSTTPDFPVIDAVSLSMSIPFAFKPYYIEDDVNKSAASNTHENSDYRGLWVDGGMLNNYPIHAFDDIGSKNIVFQGDEGSYSIALPNSKNGNFNKSVLGFRLQSSASPPKLKPQELFKSFDMGLISGLATDLYNTLMYPSEDGQIRSPEEEDRTIIIPTGTISTLDFATAELDKRRGKTKKGEGSKDELIVRAKEIVEAKFA